MNSSGGALSPRKSVPFLESVGSKSKRGKKFGASRGATGHSKDKGPSSATKKQQNELELSMDDLTESLNQSIQSPSLADKGPKLRLSEGIEADLRFDSRAGSSWKAKIAHQSRNAVVKILNQMVTFDWQQPFKRLDSGQAIGSGFFISQDGLIVTNAHVVEDAYKLYITVPSEGEERYAAQVIGVCFDVDLALIKCSDAPVRKWLELGDSNSVEYGQDVLTLGYPLGMESLKLTEGIISGRQDEYFQTDAPLNPGNSGGPMLAADGKVIGINVAIAEKSQNVGFSIPVHQLKMILESLKTRPPGKIILPKPILGAEFNYCNDMTLEFMGAPKDKKGLYVKRVYEGFPLHKAGVREGDILHTFNGFQIDNFGQATVPWNPFAKASIESLMDLMVIDSTPEIEFSSGGQLKKAKVVFEDPNNKGYPILPAIREYHPPFETIDYEIICGGVFMDLTLNHIELFHEEIPSEQVLKNLTPFATSFSERMQGAVMCTNVFMGSTLAKNEVFEAGTLVHKVNDVPVTNLTEFREAMKKPIKKGNKLYITITSKENELAVFSLQDAFREEIELSETFSYDLSKVVIDFLANSNDEMLNYVTKKDKTLKKKIKLLIDHSKKEKEDD